MDNYFYNPELEVMRWRLQVLAMGLQQQQPHQMYSGYQVPSQPLPLPFVPFHLQSENTIKEEPAEDQSSSPLFSFRPAFQSRADSVSPRLDSSSPSSYRSSPSPTWQHPTFNHDQSEPLDLSLANQCKQEQRLQQHDFQNPRNSKNCTVCNKEYTSPAALSMHMRTHTQGCKCPFCGKSFSRPWLLQGHIRTHTGEKPFTCHLCNKAFADKSNLRAHVQTHSSDKPFSCCKCGKSFALKSYLSKHEESSCLKNEKPAPKRMKSEDMESSSLSLPICSASSELSLTRLLSSPSLLPQSQISEATLQALKMAVFASKN